MPIGNQDPHMKIRQASAIADCFYKLSGDVEDPVNSIVLNEVRIELREALDLGLPEYSTIRDELLVDLWDCSRLSSADAPNDSLALHVRDLLERTGHTFSEDGTRTPPPDPGIPF